MKVLLTVACLLGVALQANGQSKYETACSESSDCGDGEDTALLCRFLIHPCSKGKCLCPDDRARYHISDRCCPAETPVYDEAHKRCIAYEGLDEPCMNLVEPGVCNLGMRCEGVTCREQAPNQFCTEGKCICDVNSRVIADSSYTKLCIPNDPKIKLVDEPCDDSTDSPDRCIYIREDELSFDVGRCAGPDSKKTCDCPLSNLRINDDGQPVKCKPRYEGGTCEEKEECSNLHSDSYTCTNVTDPETGKKTNQTTCQCVKPFVASNGICKLYDGYSCTAKDNCTDLSNVEAAFTCNNATYTCQCVSPYVFSNGKCEKYGNIAVENDCTNSNQCAYGLICCPCPGETVQQCLSTLSPGGFAQSCIGDAGCWKLSNSICNKTTSTCSCKVGYKHVLDSTNTCVEGASTVVISMATILAAILCHFLKL